MFSMLLAASKNGQCAANAMNARLPACFQILANQQDFITVQLAEFRLLVADANLLLKKKHCPFSEK